MHKNFTCRPDYSPADLGGTLICDSTGICKYPDIDGTRDRLSHKDLSKTKSHVLLINPSCRNATIVGHPVAINGWNLRKFAKLSVSQEERVTAIYHIYIHTHTHKSRQTIIANLAGLITRRSPRLHARSAWLRQRRVRCKSINRLNTNANIVHDKPSRTTGAEGDSGGPPRGTINYSPGGKTRALAPV